MKTRIAPTCVIRVVLVNTEVIELWPSSFHSQEKIPTVLSFFPTKSSKDAAKDPMNRRKRSVITRRCSNFIIRVVGSRWVQKFKIQIPARDHFIPIWTGMMENWRSFLCGSAPPQSESSPTKQQKTMATRPPRPKPRPSRRTRHSKDDSDIYAALNDFTDGTPPT